MLLTQAGSSQWPKVTLQAGLNLPLQLHDQFNKEFLTLKKSSVHGFDERNTKESKCAPRLRQLQHLPASGQKTSQPQEEQSPYFVLRRTNTVPGKVPEIFTLVSSENGGGCLGVLKEALPSLCFFPALPAGPAPPPQAAKSSLNTSLQPKPVKANNKLRIYVQRDIWLWGLGTEGRFSPGRSTPQLPGKAGPLSPPPAPTAQPVSNQTTAWPKHHPHSHRSRNVPKYLKKATPA